MKGFITPKRGLAILLCLLLVGGALGVAAAVKAGKTGDEIKQYDQKLTQGGYSLVAPINSKNAYLVNNKGKEVHRWTTNSYPGVETKLLENGMLFRTVFDESKRFGLTGAGGGVQLIDWNGNITWEYKYSTDNYVQHHDAIAMPNGNVMLLAWVKIPRQQAEVAGVNPANIDEKSNSTWGERLVEVEPGTDRIVWQWDSFDHIVQEYDETKPNFGPVSENPAKIDANYYKYSIKPDWIHANSIDYNQKTNQVMISAREYNEIWIIDRATTTGEAATEKGDLLYRWGNPEAYGQGTPADRKLFLQHNAHWIPDGLKGAGNAMIFNNGDKTRPYSTVLELSLPGSGSAYQRDGNKYAEASTVWSYDPQGKEKFYAPIVSGAQRLPNGNTLVTSGTEGTGIEVNPAGKTVWKYVSPYFDTSMLKPPDQVNLVFRIYKYPDNYPGISGL